MGVDPTSVDPQSVRYKDLIDYGYCEECEELRPPSDLIPNGNSDMCKACGNETVPGDVMMDTLDFNCDVCQVPIEFGDTDCWNCEEQYSFDYWDTLLEQFLISHLDKQHYDLDIIDASESYYLRICCNRKIEDCDCEIPLDWNDGQLIPKEIEENAYIYTSNCSSCQFYYTAQCIPYRSWMRDYLMSGMEPGEIDFCSMYRLDPTIDTRLLNYNYSSF